MSEASILTMHQIVKKFSGVPALKGVDLSLQRGEVVSLCGENGSGKSTLMKVLCGVHPHGSYEGEIRYKGEVLKASNIADTEKLGIAMIHQELTLVKELSVLENLFLGAEISQRGILDYAQMYVETGKLLKRVKLDISPDTRVGELGVGQQQLVEIAKALGKNAEILILDEPSAPLTESETEVLLDIVKQLREEKVSCVYISHKLNEVKEISDRICVIRDGEHIATRDASEISTNDIISMMVGREMTQLFPREDHDIGEVILEVGPVTAWQSKHRHLKQLNDVSFQLRRGEILGIAGLVGSGRTELMQCLFGSYEGRYEAKIKLNGKDVNIRNIREAIKLGIAMVPEDRKRHGIIPIMGVGQNISLAHLDAYCEIPSVLNQALENSEIETSIERLKVKTASSLQPIKSLSGGNQQKAVLAKLLLLKPEILILDEPTRGIDVGAKYEIYKLMFQLVKNGISIIMVSSELPEVLGISDRVLVMHEGHLKGDLVNDNLSQKQVMDCALA
ncbi:xylose ABC transporter ATP-binding protein [Alginatibacterium sediminis]|uniref:Xylose ABC transporter ATP-binding protein n=1 Tax=Alginatibacterium sediminis TaxID=2164068 RepID=A0A420E770_9ALTE|nr:xylose ABC transporter ATP-binding protein [Alginatibacterium sediminis]RKF14314.1 xylose ABC transporter ATP-binding protein [Alginatibacterium sediminis]